MGRYIGIDLGTTFSVAAYVDDDGCARIIDNQEGKISQRRQFSLTMELPLWELMQRRKVLLIRNILLDLLRGRWAKAMSSTI